jgi:hypothetical protein
MPSAHSLRASISLFTVLALSATTAASLVSSRVAAEAKPITGLTPPDAVYQWDCGKPQDTCIAVEQRKGQLFGVVVVRSLNGSKVPMEFSDVRLRSAQTTNLGIFKMILSDNTFFDTTPRHLEKGTWDTGSGAKCQPKGTKVYAEATGRVGGIKDTPRQLWISDGKCLTPDGLEAP